jgi:small conductance mechanosensitive channel
VKLILVQGLKLKYLWASLLTVVILFSLAGWGQAQVPFPTGSKPYGLVGDVVFAPVRLEGRPLFVIATERTDDDNGQWGLGSLQIRRNLIENRLQAQLQNLVDSDVDPEALQVVITQLNQQTAVQTIVNGEANRPIVTVTALDAEIYGLSEDELAEDYAQRIQQGLAQALQERQPQALRSQLWSATLGGAIALLLMAALWWGQQQLYRQAQQLRQNFHHQQEAQIHQPTAGGEAGEVTPKADPQPSLFQLKSQIGQKIRQKHVLQLLLLVTGLIGAAWILQQFPQTRSLGILLFRQPMALLLIGLSILIGSLLSYWMIDRILSKWVGTEDQLPPGQLDRRRRRAYTLSPLCKQLVTLVLILAGLILASSLFSVSTGLSLFTKIGVFGVVLSLAFQSSIKDALAGSMLLGRDAFTTGDIIAVHGLSGVVEEMGLLMTQIRNSAGDLITLRNGEITQVINHSKDWSRIDFTVLVDHRTDVKQAMQILKDVHQTLQTDPVWSQQLLGEPDILGVEQLNQDGLVLKLRSQTRPGQQFGLTREFRLRLHQAFKDAGITIPIPQREIQYRTKGPD